MSAAKKLVDLIPISTREEIVSEYKRLADERSQLDSRSRKLKKDADALKEQVVAFVETKPDMKAIIGRFIVKASRRNTEFVNIGEVRQFLTGESLQKFNQAVGNTPWFQVEVDVIDNVGEILDRMEESKS